MCVHTHARTHIHQPCIKCKFLWASFHSHFHLLNIYWVPTMYQTLHLVLKIQNKKQDPFSLGVQSGVRRQRIKLAIMTIWEKCGQRHEEVMGNSKVESRSPHLTKWEWAGITQQRRSRLSFEEEAGIEAYLLAGELGGTFSMNSR